MIFTRLDFVYFCVATFSIYHLLRRKSLQNPFLLVASYFFYGFVHPWFCSLIFGVTVINWAAALWITTHPARKKPILAVTAILTLGQLAWFKYFNFFESSIADLSDLFGLHLGRLELDIFLPVGISFFTFQALSYTVDVYRGRAAARRNFVDFALFVAFFPQLVAGPIERAERLLTAVETERKFDLGIFASAWPLIITGYLKKLVIADNVSIYADKVFDLASPNWLLLLAGASAFTLQIYADFSAYTDIARGTARLFGFELMENFNQPYSALTPSDFWRRWHISFSTWIRDYLYIPLGGSRAKTPAAMAAVVLATFGLSGLWHGAAWHFVLWGLYHGALLLIYRRLGLVGKWSPSSVPKRWIARIVLLALIAFGWTLFRASSMTWLVRSIAATDFFSVNEKTAAAGAVILFWTGLYALPLAVLPRLEKMDVRIRAVIYGLFVAAVMIFVRDGQQDFIYFQF